MSREFPPPYAPDNPEQWAEDLSDYLTRVRSTVAFQEGDDKAASDGIIMFDVSALALVLSRSGEFVQLLANKGNANLPTSDPTVAGALWNDSGTVKVSSG